MSCIWCGYEDTNAHVVSTATPRWSSPEKPSRTAPARSRSGVHRENGPHHSRGGACWSGVGAVPTLGSTTSGRSKQERLLQAAQDLARETRAAQDLAQGTRAAQDLAQGTRAALVPA